MPSLVVIFGRDRGRHFDLPRDVKLTLGRSATLANRLNDPSISREHLEFVYQPDTGVCRVYDLGSRNGARVNEKRLFKTQELRDGDVIQLGYTLLVYVCVTFDGRDSINDFLNDCEHTYESYLTHIRDHASLHVDDEEAYGSRGSMSGTLHLGNLFGKKH